MLTGSIYAMLPLPVEQVQYLYSADAIARAAHLISPLSGSPKKVCFVQRRRSSILARFAGHSRCAVPANCPGMLPF